MDIRKLILPATLLFAPYFCGGVNAPVPAAEIGSFCRLQGAETVTVSGTGLVTGLNGTGDKSNASKILAQKSLETQRYNLSTDDLSTKNTALVRVTAEIPALSRIGDKIRIRVASMVDASSLKDGVLQDCVLTAHAGGPALIRAEGRVSTGETPTSGVVLQGGQVLDTELLNRTIVDKNGIFRLILDRPNYGNAATIAQNINTDQRTNPAQGKVYGFDDTGTSNQIVARARDAKEVIVQIPSAFMKKQVEYISVVLGMDVPLTPEASIQINRQTGIITISGDVRVMPGMISYRGRTVQLTQTQSPDGQVAPATYNLDNQTPRPLVDVFGPNESAGSGQRSLQSLVDTLAAMRCTTDDIINIIGSLKENGLIQAKITNE